MRGREEEGKEDKASTAGREGMIEGKMGKMDRELEAERCGREEGKGKGKKQRLGKGNRRGGGENKD